PLHEAAIELVEIPKRAQTGKNSADIHLVVDAMDLAHSKEHIDTFVIVSGDSDFSPLVSKLKENGKHVIGLGMQDSTSELLRDNCDEFIYYEDLVKSPTLAPVINSQLPETKRKAFSLLLESMLALRRENKEVLWSSMIKDTIKRKKPSFNETYHGYRTFSELLEDAQKEGLLELDTDKRSGTYVVTRFASEPEGRRAPVERRPPARRRQTSSRRRVEPLAEAGKLSRFQAHKLLQGTFQGLVLGPYQILAPLGKGGMSAVYLARDCRDLKLVALKILPPKKAREEDRHIARFQREMDLS